MLNKDKVDATAKKYRQTEKYRESRKKYRNRPDVKAKEKEYEKTVRSRERKRLNAWRKEHREHVNAQARGYYDSDKRYDAHVKKSYGVDISGIDSLVASQNNKCPICGNGFGEGRRRRHIDHDHKTGQIRSILCSNCNLGIGYFLDDPHVLRAAADYIEIHKYEQLDMA